MASYDQAILQKFADRLYAKALVTIGFWMVIGFLVGWALGSFLPMMVNPKIRTDYGLIIAFVGGFLGFLIGNERAFAAKVEAQRLLCLMKIEQNTRSSGSSSQQTKP